MRSQGNGTETDFHPFSAWGHGGVLPFRLPAMPALEVRMKKDNEVDFQETFSFSDTSRELRGRQSIRATFKLSSGCIEAISIVARQLGIKQKSLFDHLTEDAQILKGIARAARNVQLGHLDRIQKTFVISRRSLRSIESISKQYNTPRDALVEYSVKRLLPIIELEREKHRRRKMMLDQLQQHLRMTVALGETVENQLGGEDPFSSWMRSLVHFCQNTVHQIQDFVERGEVIESFDPESLGRMLEKEDDGR
jgi:hypothetical protein